jgi:Uma2 family endonuclease
MGMPAAEHWRNTSDTAPENGVSIDGCRYLRAPAGLHFPEDAEMPEGKRHLELRTLLYQFLQLAFAHEAGVGCDQFVYWDPTDPRACLAPDAFVRFGQPDDLFGSWKVWERGAPHVAVEVVSDSDEAEPLWQDKLEKYRRLGVRELVRFDAVSGGQLLRIWDLVAGDLLERQLREPFARSRVLPGFWLSVEKPGLGPSLRLSHDERGEWLFLTPAEREAEARRVEAEAHRVEIEARQAAEQRIRELEAELRRRQP